MKTRTKKRRISVRKVDEFSHEAINQQKKNPSSLGRTGKNNATSVAPREIYIYINVQIQISYFEEFLLFKIFP